MEVISLFYSWGPPAISSVLVIVVLYLIKKTEKNAHADEKRAQELRSEITQTLNSFGSRLTSFEKDYVKNDFFYREFSGWRSEVALISDKIDRTYKEMHRHHKDIYQNIIQLLTREKNER